MTRTHTRIRQQRAAQSPQHVYLPHSSWTRVEHKPVASAPIEAADFWARLGL